MGWSSLPSPQRDEFLGRDARTTLLTTLELGIDDGTAKRVLPEVEPELSAFNKRRVAGLPGGPSGRIRRHQRGWRGRAHPRRTDLISAGGGDPAGPVPQCRRSADLAGCQRDRDRCRDGRPRLLLAGVVELNIVVQSIATMLGLGVGVDYSLIMIRRFIDEMTSLDGGTALTNTMRTAGRTVAASGTTVAARVGDSAHRRHAGDPFDGGCRDHRRRPGGPRMYRCASRGALPPGTPCGGLASAVATACPPVSGPDAGGADLPRITMARPVAALMITSAALLALAVPALRLQTFSADASILPKSSSGGVRATIWSRSSTAKAPSSQYLSSSKPTNLSPAQTLAA